MCTNLTHFLASMWKIVLTVFFAAILSHCYYNIIKLLQLWHIEVQLIYQYKKTIWFSLSLIVYIQMVIFNGSKFVDLWWLYCPWVLSLNLDLIRIHFIGRIHVNLKNKTAKKPSWVVPSKTVRILIITDFHWLLLLNLFHYYYSTIYLSE